MNRSLGIDVTGSPVPYLRLNDGHATSIMPDTVRPTLRLLPDLSQSNVETLVLISVAIFDTSSVVHLRSSPPSIPNEVLPRFFLWRSPPTLFTPAAQGGLESPPDRRIREALPHHRYSMADTILVLSLQGTPTLILTLGAYRPPLHWPVERKVTFFMANS